MSWSGGENTNPNTTRRYLGCLVFISGLVTLGAELAASRLLAPFFGSSLVVWASLIGLILAALAAGNWLGGRLADRQPALFILLRLVALAAILVGLAPDLSRPILTLAIHGMAGMRLGLFAGSFLGVLILLGAPMVLLGTVSPFAVRLATRQVEEAGRVSGRLYALSTLGSFLGAFIPALLLIPSVGTRWTFIALAILLLAATVPGFLLARRPRWAAFAALAALALALLGWLRSGAPIRPGAHVVFEGESAYQYVRVVDGNDGWRRLFLNEGVVSHSQYNPKEPLSLGEWDFFAAAPLFCTGPFAESAFQRWALIGSGAGTTARLVSLIYGNETRIDGIEPDPLVVRVGAELFGPVPPRYHVETLDGRAWLRLNRETYDVIGIDAYRQPYIPFELTTVECFRQVRAHLSTNGVLAINVVHPPGDARLVDALAATLREVFPSVYDLDFGRRRNISILVATHQATTPDNFRRNLASSGGYLRVLGDFSRRALSTAVRPGPVLTDDHAPVERLMDLMILRYLMAPGTTAAHGPPTASPQPADA